MGLCRLSLSRLLRSPSATSVFLLLLLLPFSAWASCRTEGYTVLSERVSYPDPFCGDPYELFISQCIGGNGTYTSGGYYYANCDYRFEQWSSYGATCFNKNYHNTVSINHNCPAGTVGNISSSYDRKYYCRLRCNSQLSADSAFCVNGGNQWNGTSCSSNDSTGYACITYEAKTTWGGKYTAHKIYRLNYTQKTDELLEDAPGSCVDRGFCGKVGSSGSYLSSNGTSCFENDSGAIGDQYGDGGGSSSSSSSFDWGGSSSSMNCKLTGKFSNYCYFECDNGAVGACNGNDGNCDIVSDCTWEDWKSSGSSGGSSSSGSSGGSSSGSSPGDTTVAGGIDYTPKLNEIIDTLHAGNDETRGTNAWLSKMSGQLDNLNINVAVPNNDYSGKIGEVSDSLHNTNRILSSIDSTLKAGESEGLNLDSLRSWADSIKHAVMSDSGYRDLDSAYSFLLPDTSGVASGINSGLGIGNLNTVTEGCLTISFDFANGQFVDGWNSTKYDSKDSKLDLCKLPLGGGFDFLSLFRKIMALGLAVFTVACWVWTFKDSFGGLG